MSRAEGHFFIGGLDCLDTFSAHQIVWAYKTWPTVEHAYQAAHFLHLPDLMERIRLCPSPRAAKDLANQSTFEEDPDWASKKVQVMDSLLRAKVVQHADVRWALIKSGDVSLVEANPHDSFWGCGPDGDGFNQMGQLWEGIRKDLLR